VFVVSLETMMFCVWLILTLAAVVGDPATAP
jgi:hypothetical protein